MSGAEITCFGAPPGCLPTPGRCPVSSDGQFVEQKVRRGLRRCREKIALRLLLAEATTSSGYNPGCKAGFGSRSRRIDLCRWKGKRAGS